MICLYYHEKIHRDPDGPIYEGLCELQESDPGGRVYTELLKIMLADSFMTNRCIVGMRVSLNKATSDEWNKCPFFKAREK